MKLLTYTSGAGPRCGVLQDDRVIDVTTLLGLQQPLRDVQALLELEGDPIGRVRQALSGPVRADSLPLADLKLRAPILRPPTVRDFMIFEEHATGQGSRQQQDAWYRMPLFYFSNTLCVQGPEDVVTYPDATERLDYELELGFIIGRTGKNISEQDGLSYIAGFTILNDWSARDIQADEMVCGLGPPKGKDFATSLGPWIVTTDEMAPYLKDGRLHVKCTSRVNGDVWCKDSQGGNAYHTLGSMVQRASKDALVVPGDVFGTGTVGGGSIGEAIRKGQGDAHYLQPGDVVEFDVEGIGVLRNTIGPKEVEDSTYPYRAKQVAPLPERGVVKDYVYTRTPR